MLQKLKKISKLVFIISIFVYVLLPDNLHENTIFLPASVVNI